MKEEHKEDAKRIGRNILNLIILREIEQKDLAEAIGVSEATVSSWVNGNRIPRMGTVTKICNYFGVSRSAILEDTDPYTTKMTLKPEMIQAISNYPGFRDTEEEFRKKVLEIINENKSDKNIELTLEEKELIKNIRLLPSQDRDYISELIKRLGNKQ